MKIPMNWVQNVFKLKTFVNLQNFHRLFYTFHKFFHPPKFFSHFPKQKYNTLCFSTTRGRCLFYWALFFISQNCIFRSFLLLLLLCTMNWWNEFFFLSVNMKMFAEKNNGKNVLSIISDGKSIFVGGAWAEDEARAME